MAFRRDLYATFRSWGDAFFELTDAVLCASGPVTSLPQLSIEPEFRRSHGSLYRSLAKGAIDADALRSLLVANRPVKWPAVFAVDAPTVERCDAECSPERGFYYSASKHSAGQPIVAGWHYQWICQLSWAPDSWTAPVDICRIPPAEDPTTATVTQLRRLVALLPPDGEVPMFVLDAGYDPIGISHDLATERCEVVCRLRDDRVFHTDAPACANRPPETGGRPPRHGRRWKCSDPETWPEPDANLVTSDPRYGRLTVTAWHDMHPRLSGRGHWAGFARPPIVRGSVIRVEVEHLPKPTSRGRRRCGCGGRAAASLNSAGAFAPISVASTLSTRSGSRSRPSVGRPRRSRRRNRLTGGASSSPRCSPSFASRAASPATFACPGRSLRTPHDLRRRVCDGGFVDFVQRLALRPVHRNPKHLARGDRKGPENRRKLAIRPSKRPPEQS